MKKIIYPLLAAALLVAQPGEISQAEAAPQLVSATAERKDDNLREALATARYEAVEQVLQELAPADGSVEAGRIHRRVMREYNKYTLHTATRASKHTMKYTMVRADITVDRDALAERVASLQAAAKDSTGRSCFLLRVTGALDKAAAEAVLQQSCAEQYEALGLKAGSSDKLEEARTTQLTPMSPEQYDRFTNYMLDKLNRQWLDFQLGLVGDVALSTVPGESGVTRCAHVRIRAVDADAHRVLTELWQDYTASAATEAEAERLVLQLAAQDFAQVLGERTLEALKAQDAQEAAAAAAKAKKKKK